MQFSFIIQIDKSVLSGWSKNDSTFNNLTLNPCANAKLRYEDDAEYIDKKCDYLFAHLQLDDAKVGIILLLISLFLLCFALILIVKILKSIMQG